MKKEIAYIIEYFKEDRYIDNNKEILFQYVRSDKDSNNKYNHYFYYSSASLYNMQLKFTDDQLLRYINTFKDANVKKYIKLKGLLP